MSDRGRFPVRPYGVPWVPAFTAAEATSFDARAIEETGVPQATLMENAGRSAALILQYLRPEGSVAVLAGSGNNGGDGVVVARTLTAWGRDVTLIPVGNAETDPMLAHGWSVPTLDGEGEAERILGQASVVVDGILGTGLRGAPRARHATWIERVNGCAAFICALDVPSGVGSDNGEVPGPAVRADLTVAFGGAKLGSLLHPARGYVGRLVAVEIGFPPALQGDVHQRLITQGWATRSRPERSLATHKNAVGAVTLVAGSPGMAGAAVLAARASLRAGAGLVRVVSAEANREVIQEAVPEAIFVDRGDSASVTEALEKGRGTLVGPGMGLDDEASRVLAVVLASGPTPLVVDADALTLLGEGRSRDLANAADDRAVLVTPHAGELPRIHGASTEESRLDPVRVAREASEATGTYVLLKGSPSVVAEPNGLVWISSNGSSDLAVAGMGDALAGAVTAFVAQGVPIAQAAGLGLHWTGRAALKASKGASLIPSDVIETLPDVLSESGPGQTDLPFGFVLFDQDPPT